MKLRRVLLLTLLSAAQIGLAADALEARLIPDTVTEGETFALELTASDGGIPELLQMPSFAPRGQSRSTRSDVACVASA